MPLTPVIPTGRQAERIIDVANALHISTTDVLDIILYIEAHTDNLEQRLHDLGGTCLANVYFYVGGHVATFDPTAHHIVQMVA